MKADPKEIDNALRTAGYKFLGWTNGWRSIMLDKDGNPTNDTKLYVKFGGYSHDEHPEYCDCIAKGHNDWKNPNGHWDNVQHNNRGSENTVSCDVCKIYWKYDCSD